MACDAEGVEKARLDYTSGWQVADDVLYAMCGKHPGHDSYGGIMAKVAMP